MPGNNTASSQTAAGSAGEQPAKAPPEPDAGVPASGPSEEDLRNYSVTGLVRVRLTDAAMAVQQSSPQVCASIYGCKLWQLP